MRPRSRAAYAAFVILGALGAFWLSGCGEMAPRLRYVSSQATQASWSFVVDDHASGTQLLIDGRPRTDCNHVGRTLRCELRGLFPGGHTMEVRQAGAVLRRSVVVGIDPAERPVLVRARSADDARAAAQAGADGVLVDPNNVLVPLPDLAEAAHAEGARLYVLGDARQIELAGADGVIGAELPADVRHRFPEARALGIDPRASDQLAQLTQAGPLEAATRLEASGIIEARGPFAGAFALLAPKGAIVDADVYPLLKGRKRHPALRGGEGLVSRVVAKEQDRVALLLEKGNDRVLLVWNGAGEPWAFQAPEVTAPLDLLGSTVDGRTVTVRPHDVAALIPAPGVDRTRF